MPLSEQAYENKKTYNREKMREWRIKNPEKDAERIAKNYLRKKTQSLLETGDEWHYFKHINNVRRLATKLHIIEMMGGKCLDCGFVGSSEVYDFHHMNPAEKDQGITNLLTLAWKKIIVELQKCIMLCANCHRQRHANYELLNEAKEYANNKLKGKKLISNEF